MPEMIHCTLYISGAIACPVLLPLGPLVRLGLSWQLEHSFGGWNFRILRLQDGSDESVELVEPNGQQRFHLLKLRSFVRRAACWR